MLDDHLHVVLVLAAAAVARVLVLVHLLHRRALWQRPRRLYKPGSGLGGMDEVLGERVGFGASPRGVVHGGLVSESRAA